MNNALVQRKMALNRVNLPVSYLTEEDIRQLTEACKKERDRLLITLLFQTGVRISEALALTPAAIRNFEGKPAMEIVGKGKKLRMVALPVNLKEKLESYAYRVKIEPRMRFFDINRSRAWQILNEVREAAGMEKRVFPHLLRHSDAIIRLRKTGNPKALQYHLGHNTPAMTLRYLSTLTQEDALRVQQEVEFGV
ncbi:MAG: tyrosine-type recombinase/integrase [Candidatus Omnitrophica bacterium]|nr:tyrosine-type recombinase/integrase [Candidatus Omnitrophota bacterium]MCG2713378.1 tyrosine-type recombinase/integrase [Candidatus Omnitrophota bacterium]